MTWKEVKEGRWPTWRTVRRWGQSRYGKAAAFWLIIVPTGAKLLHPIAGVHKLTVFGKEFTVNIGLPFTWWLFFAAALCFLIAQIIYNLACPDIVKEFRNFGEYREAHSGYGYLADWIRALGNRLDDNKFADYECAFVSNSLGGSQQQPNRKQLVSEWCASILGTKYREFIEKNKGLEELRSDVFHATLEAASRTIRPAMWCAFFLYMIGSTLFIWVLGQNLWFVADVLIEAWSKQ